MAGAGEVGGGRAYFLHTLANNNELGRASALDTGPGAQSACVSMCL